MTRFVKFQYHSEIKGEINVKKVILFGAGTTGKVFYDILKGQYDIICATDNDEKKYGLELVPGIQIKDKSVLNEDCFDYVIISSYVGLEEITQQLLEEFGITEDRIIKQYVEPAIRAKYTFLESFAKITYSKNNEIKGDVCEAGVYRGSFAKEINRCFPDRKLYLFDTFEGYDERDVIIEKKHGCDRIESYALSMTSQQIVLNKMPFPENCYIRKGYFPETFDLYSNTFCFVNIDLDLYQPTLSALNLFYPRMSVGGIILIHDYMWDIGMVSTAVDEFALKQKLSIVPIGDGVSVAIVKAHN